MGPADDGTRTRRPRAPSARPDDRPRGGALHPGRADQLFPPPVIAKQRRNAGCATIGPGRPAARMGEPCPARAGSAGGALMGDADDVRGWLEARRDDLLAELIGWIRLRSALGPPEN